MLHKIEKIANLGVFGNFSANSDLANFERYNIFYGLNGSGKTTLARLFAVINEGSCADHPQLKYKIKSAEGEHKEQSQYPIKIRVFNSDYVNSNIGEIEGTLNPIFIVGEENKTLVSKIQNDEKTLETLQEELRNRNTEKSKLESERGKRFTDIAKVIAADTSGQSTRNYRKPDAEKAYDAIVQHKVLEEDQLENHLKTVRQTSLDAIGIISLHEIEKAEAGGNKKVSIFEAIAIYEGRVRDISGKTSESLAIERLRLNPDIAEWVESGIALHANHNSEFCEYCSQSIPEDRLLALGKHFNDSDKQLKADIEKLLNEIEAVRKIASEITFPEKALFYDELRENYKTQKAACKSEKNKFLKYVVSLQHALENKINRRSEEINCADFGNNSFAFSESLKASNRFIETHNKKTADFDSHSLVAKKEIELHHLSNMKADIDEYDTGIASCLSRCDIIVNGDAANSILGTLALKSSIDENRQKVSNTAKAAANLTSLLQTFLGRNDLKFEPEGDGYRIMRGGFAATRLSEGEQTAITFIYFIVQLGDQDFDLGNGIVVIDDPISSLDSNSTYQAFSFLKNAVKNAKQVFLLTHSFDFLKLLLNWTKKAPNSLGKKSYYMLLCSIDEHGARESSIEPLDKELLQNESEYSYLFKQLHQFTSDGTIAGSYHIPNIARKVLETFLDFHYPGGGSMFQQLEQVDFDQNKRTALLKFANDLSHPTGKGFDPALVPETQKNVKHLLEMIQKVSPTHYNSLLSSIGAAA